MTVLLTRLAAVLGLLLVVLLSGVSPAAADVRPTAATGAGSALLAPALPIPGLPSCQTPPTPQPPDRGFSGFITPRPVDPPPLDAEPFTPGSGASIFETTGLAGFRWETYADSCIPGPGQATDQALTSTANSLMSLPVLAVGAVATLADVVYNQSWLRLLDEPVAYVSDSLYDGFTRPFFPVLAVAVGVAMIVGVRRARLSAAIGTGALVLVAATLAAFAASYPTRVADLTDSVTSTAIVSVNTAIAGGDEFDPGAATVAPLVDAILYDRWLAGTLGDTTSPTAREYGPQLFQASTLTWAETAVVREDPNGAGQAIVDAKQEQWRTAAAAVEESDPDAYEYLTGARSLDRVGHAVVAMALIGILPFLVVSLLLVAMSYLIIRLVVMFLPLVALLALLLRGTLRSLLSLSAAAVINSVVFAVGAAVTAYLYGVFLSPDSGIPALLGILLAFVTGITMWIVLSPYRRLTTMVGGKDAVKQTKDEVKRLKKTSGGFVTGAGKVAVGVFAGQKAARMVDAAGEAVTAGDEGAGAAGEARYSQGASRPEHFAAGAWSDAPAPPVAPVALPAAAPVLALAGPARALPGPRPALGAAAAAPVPASPTAPAAPRPRPDVGGLGPVGGSGPGGPARGVDEVDGSSRYRRPEMTPLQDFDPVVVDGQQVAVIHTLDGDHVDLPAATGAVLAGEVVEAEPGRTR